MKTNKTKSAMTALVIAAMLCTAAMPVKAADSQWVKTDGTWSYVKEDGSKATGWIKDGGCWYAFDADGAMRTGWIASNEHWYFMGESGVMQSDAWVEDNGAKYYIKGTGVMAKDYVKDGYELTSDGKAIPLGESGSVVVTDPAELEGKVIEGNLYVDVTTAKELELKGVTVKGKLVVLGDNETAGKVTLTDSKVETINTQTRNAEVVLSGKTEVKNVVIEETAKVTPDKNYKGEVENIEVQSTTKGEVVIDVPAENVSTRTYATVDVQAPVGNLEVKTDTQVKVNADVKNVTVTETAKDTTVEVSKGNTVGTITADAPVKIDGKGTVDKVEANVDGVEAGKDTTIKDVETGKDVTEAPDVTKPDKGGSSGGSGGGSTPTPAETVFEVKSYSDLRTVLTAGQAYDVIKLMNDIEVVDTIEIPASKVIKLDLNGNTITFAKDGEEIKDGGVTCFIIKGKLTVKDSVGKGVIKTTGLNSRAIRNENGVFILESGTIELASHAFSNAAIVTDSGDTKILGGKIISTSYGISGFTDAKIELNHANIKSTYPCLSGNGLKSGVEFKIQNSILESEDVAVYFPSTETLIIDHSTIYGKGGALDIRAGTTIVSNSTLSATGTIGNNQVDNLGFTDETGSTISIKARNEYASLSKTISVNIDSNTILNKTAGNAHQILMRASKSLTENYTINLKVVNHFDLDIMLSSKENLTANINDIDAYFMMEVKESLQNAIESFNTLKDLGKASLSQNNINVQLNKTKVESFTGTGVIDAFSKLLSGDDVELKVNDVSIDKNNIKQSIITQLGNIISDGNFINGSAVISFDYGNNEIISYNLNISIPEESDEIPNVEQPINEVIVNE